MDCALCQIEKNKNKVLYEDKNFIVVECWSCKVPMLVLKEHRIEFSAFEKRSIQRIFYGILALKGTIDYKMRQIPGHAHAHLR